MPGVLAVDAVTGAHSVVAVLRGEDARSIAERDVRAVRSIKGVRQVTTCFAVYVGAPGHDWMIPGLRSLGGKKRGGTPTPFRLN